MPLMMWITEEHGLAVCAMPMPDADGISMPEIIDYGLRKAFVDLGKPMYGAFIGEALVRRTRRFTAFIPKRPNVSIRVFDDIGI